MDATKAVAALLAGALALAQNTVQPDAKPWGTCNWIIGKGGTCKSGAEALPLHEFLQMSVFTREKSEMAAEAEFDLRNGLQFKTTTEVLGSLGGRQVRQIRFLNARATEYAGILVIERDAGLHFPLMRWYGGPIPKGTIHKISIRSVLVIQEDFGGNVPMVSTWAWVLSPSGPRRLDVENTIRDGLQKVAPGHSAYDTGLDWKTLCTDTYAWGPEGHPGKIGVHEEARVCLQFQGDRLVPRSAEWREREGSKPKRWP
jgi:hypothetical protein